MFFKYNYRIQLSPEPGSGGGYSMSDLDNEEEPEKGNQETEEEKAAKQKEIDDKAASDLEAQEAEKQRLAEEKQKADELAASQSSSKKGDESSTDNDEDEEASFWDEVDALRGSPVEVEYGDVDPLSPEGALLREKAIEENAVSTFESELERLYPRAYAYLIHTSAGGKDEDFFSTVGNTDLPTPEQLEVDIELQKQIITQDLKAKGNNDRMISVFIKELVASDDLEETAKEALKDRQAAQQASIEQVKAAAEQETAKKASAIKEMTNYVAQVVATGKIDNITIPEADRKAFADSFNKNVRFENGKFVHVTELTDANMAEVFKSRFYEFKGGKIDGLVEQKARTLNAQRIGKTLQSTKKVKTSGGVDDSNFVSLGDI